MRDTRKEKDITREGIREKKGSKGNNDGSRGRGGVTAFNPNGGKRSIYRRIRR